MSHFSVLVIGEDVEELLAPYDENECVEEYIDIYSEDVLKTFNEFYNKCLDKKSKDIELDTFEITTLVHGPLDSLKNPIPAWFKKWWLDWSGHTLDEDGNAISTYNKDSKWDWYQIGGRWAGTLPLKSNAKSGEVGNASWTFENENPYANGNVDSALVKDIDWKRLDEEEAKYCNDHWERLKADPMFRDHYENLVKRYKTKENYIKIHGHFTTYAVVDKNGWYAKGDMGWWGMSSETQEESDSFDKSFYDSFIKNLNPNERITIVDCHI